LALNYGNFETAFIALLEGRFNTDSAAADEWAEVYWDYAQDAEDPNTFEPEFLGTEKDTLSSALESLFETKSDDPATAPGNAATAIANALQAFWLTPPIVFDVGAVTLSQNTATLITDLTTIFQSLSTDSNAKAIEIATAIDAFTHGIYVEHVDPLVSGTIT